MMLRGLRLLSRSANVGSTATRRPLLFPSPSSVAARGMGTVTYSPPAVKIGQPAPTFKAVRCLSNSGCVY